MVIRPTELKTSSEVIDAVGGTTAAQKLTRKKTPQVITNWRRNGRLPPDTYLQFQTELARLGLRASPALWGIADPSVEADGVAT
jgi:hypothetical protein